MNDPVLRGFLESQYEAGMDLAARSDILELEPIGGRPVQRYVARFHAKGLVWRAGDVVEADCLDVGIRFSNNYLEHADAAEVLTILAPANVWTPNMRNPFICPGFLPRGTALTDLLYQTFEIWTYQTYTTDEMDTMNPAACGWARENRHRFPIDPRPLCRPRPVQEAPR
jgi:hypothetical protein